MTREAFEEWAKEKGLPYHWASDPPDFSLHAWIAWQAATVAALERAALVCDEQADANLSATTKALTFARTALLVVNSGASQKAIALIDEALNQAPVTQDTQKRKPMEDGEKIYKLWHSSDANDLDDFLDGWRHAEAFHGITKLAPTGSELPTNSADQAEVTSQGQIPAWHDAPTCPGLWISDDFEGISTFNSEDLQMFKTSTGVRWFGPIAEDKQ